MGEYKFDVFRKQGKTDRAPISEALLAQDLEMFVEDLGKSDIAHYAHKTRILTDRTEGRISVTIQTEADAADVKKAVHDVADKYGLFTEALH